MGTFCRPVQGWRWRWRCRRRRPVRWAADVITLTPENWDAAAPRGKEVDAIYGDYVLRGDQIVVVVGRPGAERHANLTVKSVGGALLDLTRTAAPNDQLSAYFPGASRYAFHNADNVSVWTTDPAQSKRGPNPQLSGAQVSLQCEAEPVEGKPRVSVRYTVADGQPYVLVESILQNPSDKPLTEDLADAIRADRLFDFGQDAETGTFWAHDDWFEQAYGIQVERFEIKRDKLLQLVRDGKSQATIAPGETLTIRRRIFPGEHLLAVRATAGRLKGQMLRPRGSSSPIRRVPSRAPRSRCAAAPSCTVRDERPPTASWPAICHRARWTSASRRSDGRR